MTPTEPAVKLLLRQFVGGYPANPVPRPTWQRALSLALVVVIGGLLATAYRRTSDGAQTAGRTRAGLVDQIHESRSDLDAAVRHRDKLADEGDATAAQIREEGENATSAVTRRDDVTAAAGTEQVRGPGVTVTVADGPVEPGDSSGVSRIVDRDLHELVNALWAAGAEAIAIDGHRLTATTAIRNVGQGILVGLAPVTGPYEIDAIGNPRQLKDRFSSGAVAQRFLGYAADYGITFEVTSAARLALPAASVTKPEYAKTEVP